MHEMPKPLPGSRMVERVRSGHGFQPWPPQELRRVQSSWRGPLHARVEGVQLHLRYVGLHQHNGRGAYPLHRHPYTELALALEGRGQFHDDEGGCEDVAPGDLVVFPPQAVHGTRWRMGRRAWPLLVIDFDLSLEVPALPLESGETCDPAIAPFYEWFLVRRQRRLRLKPSEWSVARAHAAEMARRLAAPAYGMGVELLSELLHLVAHVSRCLRARGWADGRHVLQAAATPSAALLNARTQLESHVVFSPGAIRSLARASGFSEAHFIRAFRAAFGVTPKQYAQRLLMRRACGLLNGTDLPIRQIAAQLKYEDAAIFSRAFRRFVGVSPSDFRAST